MRLNGQDWWIVETAELGRTATPGRLFAFQASEVCRGAPYNLKVTSVRPARPGDAGDLLAIKQSQQEINEVMMDQAQRAGVLNHKHHARRDTGRVITLGH